MAVMSKMIETIMLAVMAMKIIFCHVGNEMIFETVIVEMIVSLKSLCGYVYLE